MTDSSDTTPVPPAWADAELSRGLPELALAGERQDLEMKERFPEQARDLAKEIAAFATSNAGTILLGVSDSGEIVGLTECDSRAGRTQLIQRIEGLCANVVKPRVTPAFRFGVVDGRIVLAIDVPKGGAPLVYVGNIPYLRQITAARPAEPEEVIEHVLRWHRSSDAEQSPEAQFLSRVASLVVDVLVHAGELDERRINPWLEDLRRDLALLAAEARDLAVFAPDELSDIAVPLEALATKLDRAAHERLTLGGGLDEMGTAAEAAINWAREIRHRWIDTTKIDERSVAGLRDTVTTTARRLAGLASRLEEMDEQNRLDEIQSEAAERGLILLKAATFGLGLGDKVSLAELSAIGRQLRDVETRTIYADGGQSVQRILDDIRGASTKLDEWLARLHVREPMIALTAVSSSFPTG